MTFASMSNHFLGGLPGRIEGFDRAIHLPMRRELGGKKEAEQADPYSSKELQPKEPRTFRRCLLN